MKGVRFYLEYPSPQEKNRRPAKERKHSGNVVAVWLGKNQRPISYLSEYQDEAGKTCYDCMFEAMVAVYFHPNSAVCGHAVSANYLKVRCVRISEARAREIHPALFWRLDQED